MNLKRPALRPVGEPIIALIDVVFFLLVFFMLVARLDASAPFEVVPPFAVTGRDMPGGGVTLSVAEDGALAVNGTAVAATDWKSAVVEAQAEQRATLIRVNAHRAVALRHVLPLVAELERLTPAEVVLVVAPPGP